MSYDRMMGVNLKEEHLYLICSIFKLGAHSAFNEMFPVNKRENYELYFQLAQHRNK